MIVSDSVWAGYVRRMRAVDKTAARMFEAYLNTHEHDSEAGRKAAIDYAYALATRYGESSAALSCEMYDAVAEAAGMHLPAAEPAATATYGEVAKTVNGIMKQSDNAGYISSGVERLVKQAGADTTMKNAIRDGAEWAWIPRGDTCSFCIMLASNGWQLASRKTLKGDHAEHIHANCDCEFAICFNGKPSYASYDPEKYKEMYDNAEGDTWQEKLNSMRRDEYAANSDKINAQKRDAYAGRIGLKDQEKGNIIKPNYDPDIRIGKSLGAKHKDTFVRLPNGEEVLLTQGQTITKVQTIAGAGRNREIDELPILMARYPATKEELWQKRKGFGYVDYDGESFLAEIHWYEEPSVGRVEFKIKPDAGGNWFYED